jgi:hypothetical protein
MSAAGSVPNASRAIERHWIPIERLWISIESLWIPRETLWTSAQKLKTPSCPLLNGRVLRRHAGRGALATDRGASSLTIFSLRARKPGPFATETKRRAAKRDPADRFPGARATQSDCIGTQSRRPAVVSEAQAGDSAWPTQRRPAKTRVTSKALEAYLLASSDRPPCLFFAAPPSDGRLLGREIPCPRSRRSPCS